MRQPARPQADGSGYFAPPTLVLGDLEGAEVCRAGGLDRLSRRCRSRAMRTPLNASRFGLAHAVFSADEARGAKCASAFDAPSG